MPSRPARVLTILLLLAAAFPPPQVANGLIAGTSRHDPAEARKPPRARGRNRVSPPARPDFCQAVSPLASGADRPSPPSRFLPRREEAGPGLARTAPASPISPAILRLRC